MFGLSVATELFQGSTERTWNCVLHFIHLLWTKLNHVRQPIMPRSRKRHHSHSRSRSRSHSRDRSRERDDKHKRNDSHDRDGKRRKIESYDSPNHKRSVSSEPENHTAEIKTLDKENGNNLSKCEESDKSEDNSLNLQNGSLANESIECGSLDDENEKKCDQLKFHKTTEDMEVSLDGSDKINVSEENEVMSTIIVLDSPDAKLKQSQEGSTLTKKKETLEITPKKVLSPKQLQKKLESEKKRNEKEKEKEVKERKRMEEKERIKQEKLKKTEQKLKEREIKEEQKKKDRMEKEEQKRKEKEEKEQKRKEKEEQKRKEREEEKLKKLQEIEEKNKEKQKEEEKKQKAAAAFVNFFVAKKTDTSQEDKKQEEMQSSAFMAFEVKSDMKLPPTRRSPLSEDEKETLRQFIETQDEEASYLKDLKSCKLVGKSSRTWPYEEVVDDDIAIIEDESDLGETIFEDKSKLQTLRAKFLKFHENRRPPYFGTWRKKSEIITPRRPFAEDKVRFNYEEDSDDDWEEEEQGESLNGSDDEADKENEDDKDDYEVDNEFFVPHGHLSDDEVDDEEKARLSPESLKQKLKLLKDEFDQDMQSKTHKLKPRSIGCIWYNKNGDNVEEAINRYLQPLAMITLGQVNIEKRSDIFSTPTNRKIKPTKELNPEYIPMFLKVIHGNCNRKKVLVEQFLTYMANNGISVDISKATLVKNLRSMATWRKCRDDGPMKNKFGWFVNEDTEKKYSVDLVLPNILAAGIK